METTTTIEFADGKKIFVGQECTISIGDSYPAKVLEINRVRGGWEITLQQYRYKATEEGLKQGAGHQDWVILWDQPFGTHIFKTNLKGKILNSGDGYKYTMGKAHVHHVWEF